MLIGENVNMLCKYTQSAGNTAVGGAFHTYIMCRGDFSEVCAPKFVQHVASDGVQNLCHTPLQLAQNQSRENYIGRRKNYVLCGKNYIRHNSNYIGHKFHRSKHLKANKIRGVVKTMTIVWLSKHCAFCRELLRQNKNPRLSRERTGKAYEKKFCGLRLLHAVYV